MADLELIELVLVFRKYSLFVVVQIKHVNTGKMEIST